MVMLINGYGITETTVYSTFKVITEEEILQHTRSIGRPLSGTYVYILAPDLSLCPIGVVGELYIGGLGVGRGYVGRPELTSDRFVDDPFKPRNLLYRSGDLVRWLANGDIEYVCRADTQVKVRGYRVEISEIEAALTAYSTICDSVVLAETQGGTTQLIAFFTSETQEDLAQLRSHLEGHLPNYMVPSRFVQVDRIPVTPNGKVDRAQLLSTRPVVTASTKRSAPNALEKLLIKTWADIVGLSADEIGVDDSFFAIGGDSIGANLVVRMLESQGLQVELLDLFENPTLRALANVIVSRREASANAAQGVSERTAYWTEMASTRVPVLLVLNDRNAAAAKQPLTATVHVPLVDLTSAHAGAEGEFELRDVLLTSLGVSLRMWSGAGTCRVGVLQRSPRGGAETEIESSLLVAPVILTIKDIHLQRENLTSVRDSVRRSANYQLAWDEAIANPAYRPALENGVVFHDRDIAGDIEKRPFDLRTVPSGCILVDCLVSKSDAALTFTVSAGATDAERLQFLAEAFKFAFRETVRSLRAQKAQVSLDVEPFNDVFFRDCTLQALVAAVRYFGRDLHALLANTTAICVRDLGRSRGLRVRVKYLERRPLDEVLAETGVSVYQSAGRTNICEDLLECLSGGSLGIVKIDCYFVERQREFYQKRHGDHTVLVCGYDRERRLFEIIDNDAAHAVQYRRTTIDFDELRAAYDGFQETFNPRGGEISNLTVSDRPLRQEDQHDRTAARRAVLETLRLAHEWSDEERAAMGLLHDDFCVVSASERLFMEHVEQLSFTVGEIVLAKRLLSYQLGRILEHSQLAQLAAEMLSRLEIVNGLLTKLRVSHDYAARKVQSMRTKLYETQQLDLKYAESVKRMLEEV